MFPRRILLGSLPACSLLACSLWPGPAAASAPAPGPDPGSAAAQASHRLCIVSAENVYGDVARQIEGPGACVDSILNNPDEDPHLFEASPSVARALARAQVVVVNGADYDPWMDRLLAATRADGRREIVVAHLVGVRPGDNPHLWYDPQTMRAYAAALTATLVSLDPQRAPAFSAGEQRFLASLAPVERAVARLRGRYAGTAVSASEPVFGLMAGRLGLVMRDERLQRAVMNDVEPRPSDMARLEDELRRRQVAIFFYNSQASDDSARRLLAIARASGVPVVGVTEAEPPGQDYAGWMLATLAAVSHALASRS